MTLRCSMSLAVALVVLLLSTAAYADGERCEYDLQCSQGETCWDAVCTPNAELPDYVGADDACGSDRRCRIDRLQRRSSARRQLTQIREEELVRDELERIRQRELDDRPREKHPWSLGWRFTPNSPTGLTAGYTFSHPFRVEASFLNIDEYFFQSSFSEGSVEGDLDVDLFDLGIVYNVLSGTSTPYLKAGAMYGAGSFSNFNSFQSTALSSSVPFHALNFEAGFDFAFDFGDSAGGLHFRFGAALRPLIFHQARVEPGVYDESVRDAMSLWWEDNMLIDFNFIIGWGF